MYKRYSADFIFVVVVVTDIASDVINITLVITGEDCTDERNKQLWKELSKMVTNLFTCR